MTYKLPELIDKFLKFQENIQSCSVLTLKAYRLDLEQAYELNKKVIKIEHLRKLEFNKSEELWFLTRDTLTKWSALSLASRNRKIATLKSFFNFLYDEKIIDKNFGDQLICPKVPKKIPHFISVDEVLAVLKVLEEDQKLKHEAVLFHLLYGGGLRISEACSLRWKDIDFDNNRLRILGKGDKVRLVVLPTVGLSVLKKKFQEQPTEPHNLNAFVFGETPLNPRKGFEFIRSLGKKAGLLNPLNPHSLRHSYATHLLASGANLRILQKLLGHESLQATEKYTHLNIDSLARLVEVKHPLSKRKF